MDVGDFDGDGLADLAFTGWAYGANPDHPVFIVWYHLDADGYFQVREETPSFLCSDVVAVQPGPGCPAGVVLTDPNGSAIEYWRPACDGTVHFLPTAYVSGYAGLSPGRGMGGAIADLDGDGQPELVTKQKLGTALDYNQLEITYCRDGGATWIRVDPTPLNTLGFQNQQTNEILRPKNLAVGDLFGNTLPEIVAGFGPTARGGASANADQRSLRIAIWMNSCIGDVNRNGYTDCDDLAALMAAYGSCRGQANFNPDADLDKSGCIDNSDLDILMHDVGCYCW
jgi:hypothetical protein